MQSNVMQTKSHTIPADLVIDAMRILFENHITFSVEGINEHENTLLIKTSSNGKHHRHRKALDNLKEIILDYKYYREDSVTGNFND